MRVAACPGERRMNDQSGAMERLLLRRDADGVAWLTLNRPAARNALSMALMQSSSQKSRPSNGTRR